MISHSNDKLGLKFWSFSLPVENTCHWRTPSCDSVCYAQSGRFVFGGVKKRYQKNFELAQREDFASLMRSEIIQSYATHFRIHASGDFYSEKYVRDWHKVIADLPDVTFLAYTRSWRTTKSHGSLLKFLRPLAALKNMRLHLSTDRDTGAPPEGPWQSVVYMAMDDNDVPDYKVNLVFRVKRKTVMKRSETGTIVCPPENGVQTASKITCSSCGICYRTKTMEPYVPGRISLKVT